MLDQLKPALLSRVEVRRRSDGTEGIYDPETGHTFETTAEQANLVQLFDGQRSMLEVSAEYLNKYGFVPFAALDELVRGLAGTALLVNPPEGLARQAASERSLWVDAIQPTTYAAWKDSWPRTLRMLELVLWPAFALWVGRTVPHSSLSPLAVPLAYVGAVLAMTLRARMKAAVCAMFGYPPRRTQFVSIAGIFQVAPDPGVVVLLDKRQRVLAHLGALAGVWCALAIASPWPGPWAGAFVVMVVDLCPVIRSSTSGVLTALSGDVGLTDRVRAWVGLPLLAKLFAGKILRSDRVFFIAGLLSLAWVGLVLYTVLGLGLENARHLIELGVMENGAMKVIAWVGGVFLISISPLPIIVLVHQLIDSAFATLWPADTGGKHAQGVADSKVFRAIPLFSRLADDDLAAIASFARAVSYDPGQVIVEEGSAGHTFYVVQHGVAEVARGEAGLHGRVVAKLGPGDCFGETAMLKDGVRTATVRAMSPVDVIELPTEAFEKVMAKLGGVDFTAVLRAAGAIGKSKLFRELPADRLSSLATKFVPRSVPAGTDVIRYGEKGDEFYLVARGQVEVLSSEGKKLVQLGDGDHFGEIALLRNVPRTATVRTLTDTLLLVLSREVFLQALQADLSLSERAEAIATSRAPQPAPPPA